MNVHRKFALMFLVGLLALAGAGNATALAPFIDLQEAGLSVTEDGEGLMFWDHTTPATLNVNVGGSVRFALLYWAGRERPCNFNGSTCTFSQPYKDQEMVFNGTPLTGTVIGTESQPTSAGGPILNIGYFADVTSLVSAAGPGAHSFTFTDGNGASNLWRLDGVGLFIAYTDAADSTFYRLLVWDNLDFAYGDDPTPGDNRVTSPVTFGHGAMSSDRAADLWLFAGDGEASRPDETTISNNPTLFNVLDSSPDGEEWTTDQYTINIPANVDNTVVQMNSTPPGQNPDSLLWEMAALRVPLSGELQELPPALPTCPATVIAGPPTQLRVTFQDTGSGLVSLVVTQSTNADTVVPPFIPGTVEPVVVVATKINQSQSAHVTIQATDGAGNVANCDPIVSLVQRNVGSDPQWTYVDVPQAEGQILIMNGARGIKNFTATVNGVTFKVTGLKDGENRTLDVSSAMQPGTGNLIIVKGHGPKDSSATVVIHDGSVQ